VRVRLVQCRETTLVRQTGQRVVLVHELAELGGREELLDRRHHGRMLMSVWGAIASTSWVFMRSRTTRSMRERPVRRAFWISSPTLRMRRLAKWSWSSMWYVSPCGAVARQVQQVRRRGQDLGLGEHVHGDVRTLQQVAEEFDVLGDFVAELAVKLVAADATEVVALLGEEGALEVLTAASMVCTSPGRARR